MTTSAPTSVRVPGSYIVGMPPPPVQIDHGARSSSQRIGRISKIRFGSGEATTRRHLSPSCLMAQPFSAASRSASASLVDRADELGRVAEGGIVRVDLDHRQDASRTASRSAAGCPAPARSCSRSSPRSGRPGRRAGTSRPPSYAAPWSASRPTCGPLPWETTSSCSAAIGRQLLRPRVRTFCALVLGGHRLPAPEQRVAAQRDDDAHRRGALSRRSWRRGPP